MSDVDITQAQLEVRIAEAFGYPAPEWALTETRAAITTGGHAVPAPYSAADIALARADINLAESLGVRPLAESIAIVAAAAAAPGGSDRAVAEATFDGGVRVR